jgi:hypothetical protein
MRTIIRHVGSLRTGLHGSHPRKTVVRRANDRVDSYRY